MSASSIKKAKPIFTKISKQIRCVSAKRDLEGNVARAIFLKSVF